jgi:L-rhamnose mutarotase
MVVGQYRVGYCYFNMASEKTLREQELNVLMEWVREQIDSTALVPRVDDVVHYARQTLGYTQLKRAAIAKQLRLHPYYLMNSSQQRIKHRSKRYRPIIANALGMLHGDIGFYAVVRDYETPKKYRGGYIVLKDILSRFLYVALLDTNRNADSIIKALKNIFQQHNDAFGPSGHKIKSIAFDQEPSVMSNKVQNFLRDHSISFHPFQFSSSKSKMAENAIRLIRTDMKRIRSSDSTRYWWKYMDKVLNNLNSKTIVIKNKRLKWSPKEVDHVNLEEFVKDLQKADPAYHFSQFDIAPQLVNFKFPLGTIVRPKLIVTSSAAIGEKRSEINLEKDPFVVEEQIPFVNANWEIGNAYKCINKNTGQVEIFDEHELAESTE